MDFNDRVLQLAEDTEPPLLERLKFCAIYESNLDEFFMVRVAGVHDKIVAVARPPAGPTGSRRSRSSPRSASARSRSASGSSALLRRRAAAGARRARDPDHLLSRGHRRGARRDRRAVRQPRVPGADAACLRRRPALPVHLEPLAEPPVVLRDPVQDTEVIARVKVPKELLRRFLPLGDGNTFVALEDVISHNLEALFPGMEVSATRSSGSPATPTTTSPTRPTTSAGRSRRRSAAAASARSIGSSSTATSSRGCASGWSRCSDRAHQVYDVGWIGLDDLFDIAGVSGFDVLRYPPFSPVTQTRPDRRTPRPRCGTSHRDGGRRCRPRGSPRTGRSTAPPATAAGSG